MRDLFENNEEDRNVFARLQDPEYEGLGREKDARAAAKLLHEFVIDLFKKHGIKETYPVKLMEAMAKILVDALPATRSKPDGTTIFTELDLYYSYMHNIETGLLYNITRYSRYEQSSFKRAQAEAERDEPAPKRQRLNAVTVTKKADASRDLTFVKMDTSEIRNLNFHQLNKERHMDFVKQKLIDEEWRLKGNVWKNLHALYYYGGQVVRASVQNKYLETLFTLSKFSRPYFVLDSSIILQVFILVCFHFYKFFILILFYFSCPGSSSSSTRRQAGMTS